jgi:hypothetical protein
MSLIQRGSFSPAYLTAKEGCKHKICKSCITNILNESAVGQFMICPVDTRQGKFDVTNLRYEGVQLVSGSTLFGVRGYQKTKL